MNQQKKSIVYFNDGSVSAPTATFGLDSDTGMYRIGDGIIGFASNGVEALRITASGQINAGDTIQANNLAVLGDSTLKSLDVPGLLSANNLAAVGSVTLNNTDILGKAYFGQTINSVSNLVFNNGTALNADVTSESPTINVIKDGTTGIHAAITAIGANTDGAYLYAFKTRSASEGADANTVVNSGDDILAIYGYGADGASYIESAKIAMAVDGTPGTDDMPGRIVFSTTADAGSSVTERVRINSAGNMILGTTAVGTSGAKVLGIGNGTEPSSSPADMIQLYSIDLSAGNATLGLRTETAVATEAALASTHTLAVRINGATYRVMLTNA